MLSRTLPIALDDTPSLLDYTLLSKLSRRSHAHSRARSQVHSQLHSMTLPACLTIAPKLALKTLPSTPPSTFSCTLPSTLSNTLLIALDDTLPACLTIRSQVSSQDAPKYTPSTLPSTPPSTFSSTLPSMLSNTLPIALDDTLPAYLALRSQVHSQEARHSQSHLTICSLVCSCMLDPETCRVAGARHQSCRNCVVGEPKALMPSQYICGMSRPDTSHTIHEVFI